MSGMTADLMHTFPSFHPARIGEYTATELASMVATVEATIAAQREN